MQTLTTRMYTHPYEYMYASPTPMSTSEWLSWRFPKSPMAHRRRRERRIPLDTYASVNPDKSRKGASTKIRTHQV
jgi:hypothetical protein